MSSYFLSTFVTNYSFIWSIIDYSPLNFLCFNYLTTFLVLTVILSFFFVVLLTLRKRTEDLNAIASCLIIPFCVKSLARPERKGFYYRLD